MRRLDTLEPEFVEGGTPMAVMPGRGETDLTIDARLSLDGSSVLLVGQRDDGIFDIRRHDLERSRSQRLTFEDQVEYFPTWTLDGERMLHTGGRTAWRRSGTSMCVGSRGSTRHDA